MNTGNFILFLIWFIPLIFNGLFLYKAYISPEFAENVAIETESTFFFIAFMSLVPLFNVMIFVVFLAYIFKNTPRKKLLNKDHLK